jgi:hypothetical protein
LGETALHDALRRIRLSDRQDTKRPVVIAFSDGADTASWMTEKNVDDAARQSWRHSSQRRLARLPCRSSATSRR